MKKTVRNLILLVVAVLLVAAIAGCDKQETPGAADSALQINTIKFMPMAYLDESFDLRDVLLMEEGVEYSATGCYVEVKQDETTKEFTISETALEVVDLCFTPKAIAENVITLTAKRGNETAQKVIYIATTIHAEPLDDLYKSSGELGGSDPGISKSVNIDPLYLQGENSTTSLHVEWSSMDPHPWGNLFLNFSSPLAQEHFTDQKWENAIVTFWVYNPNELPIEFQFRLVDEQSGANLDWSGADGPHKMRAEPGQWTQLFCSLRKVGGTTRRLTADKYTNDMLTLKFRYDGYSTTEAYSFDFYMDNIDVVDASMYPEIDTKNVRTSETIEQGWENVAQDVGWQGVYTEYDHEVQMGEGSKCALKIMFNQEKSLTNSFWCLQTETNPAFNGNLDMTAGKLHGYFKFEGLDPKVSVDIVNNKWATSNKVDMTLTPVGDGWYKAELDLQKLEVGNHRNDHIVRVRFHFSGANKDSVVYVDTMKFDYVHIEKVYEAPSTDWINMTMDTGSFYFAGEKKFSTSYLKGGNTVRSLMLKAPADAVGKMTWNTGSAAESGEISATPNMNKGTLGAWFYFGKQLPNATFVITNKAWKGSTPIPFIFTKNTGDGWYYGELHGSDIKCPEGGGTAEIIRMMLQIPKGYTIYVDNLKWTPGVENPLVAAELDPSVLYDGGDMLADTNTIAYNWNHWDNYENHDFNKDGKPDADDTVGLTCGVSNSVKTGPYSVRSWYFKATAENNFGAAVAQLPLSKAYDMTGKNLAFDILVDTDCKFQQTLSFRLQTKAGWANINEINPIVKVNPGEWKHVVISFQDIALNPELLKDLGFISITFDFAGTVGFERTIYIDNVLLTNDPVTAPEEPLVKGDIPETDWTNMVQDKGDYYHASQVNEIDMSMHYGEDSIKSLHFVSPADREGKFTLNTDYAVTKGEIEAAPCMNEGMLSAWFYFGDQAPSAKVRLTDKAWKGSIDVPFIFTDAPVDGWYYGKLNTASITYTEISNPEYAIRVTVTIPAGYDVYIDNMVFDPTPVVMGPEWLYDGGDLLANATMEWNPADWDGDPGSYDKENGEIYTENEMGAYSVKSWKLYTERNDLSNVLLAQLHLRGKYDLTGKNLEFDVKFANANQTIGIELWNGWTGLQPDGTVLFTVTGDGSEGWQTITIPAEDIEAALAGKAHNEIMLIRFRVDLRSEVEGEHAVYIDNLRFTESDFFEVESDLLANATAEAPDWTEENGVSYGVDTENVFGEQSTRSWMFQANAGVETSYGIMFDLGENVDMTGKYLVADVKSENVGFVAVQLADGAGEAVSTVSGGFIFESEEDWQALLLNPDMVAAEGKDLTAVRYIVFAFDFVSAPETERVINLDNVRLVDAETAEQDMIHLPVTEIPDVEASEMMATLDARFVKAENSTASLRVETAAASATINYAVDSLNLKHRGTVGAWFYFGDQAAAASLKTYAPSYKESASALTFQFGENQNGWYYGTVNLADATYDDDSANGNVSVLQIIIAENTVVYIDGMNYVDFQETAADDMIHLISGTTATLSTDKLYGNMSTKSLFVPAAAKAANMDFVPASALDFTGGKITAWFYFGDATPSTVRFVAYKGSSNTGYVTFTFGEGVDGWYLGTADLTTLTEAKQAPLSAVDKFRIQVAKGADVYIDNLIFVAVTE